MPRTKHAIRLAHYITHIELIEKHISNAIEIEKKAQSSISESRQLDIPNSRFNANLAKQMNADAALKEKENEFNLSIIKTSIDKLYTLSNTQIEKLYFYLFDNSILFPQTPNMSFSEKIILTTDLPKKLSFVASYKPGILTSIKLVTENLNQLNFMIREWNNLVAKHQALKNPTIQEMVTHISYFFEFSYDLHEIGVEGTLMSIKIRTYNF